MPGPLAGHRRHLGCGCGSDGAGCLCCPSARVRLAGGDSLSTVGSLVIFTVPGVIIGGQIGPQIAKRVPEQRLVRSLGWLFLLIGVITLIEAFVA